MLKENFQLAIFPRNQRVLRSSWHYCSSRKFYGCPLENGEESYCFVCQIRVGYDIQEIEQIEKPTTLIKLYNDLMEDIQNFIDFEPKIDHFW